MDPQFISAFGKSNIGNYRQENQDRFILRSLGQDGSLLAVADGMGGESGGGLAATTAIEFLENELNGIPPGPSELAVFLKKAGDVIISLSERDEELKGMGTTMTAVVINKNLAVWAHVGDSRLYLFRDGRLRQVTRDHSFLWELIQSKDITQAEALKHPLRSVLDQCLGAPDVLPDSGSFELVKKDLLILTTDGIHDSLSGEEMQSVLGSSVFLSDMAEKLTEKAMDHGGKDNLTVVICRIEK